MCTTDARKATARGPIDLTHLSRCTFLCDRRTRPVGLVCHNRALAFIAVLRIIAQIDHKNILRISEDYSSVKASARL